MNPAVVLSLFLFLILVIAGFWGRWSSLSSNAPLDVDEQLPLPWAGYASSVFSLTGLFAAYLGALVVLGPWAFLGIGVGVIHGLFILRASLQSKRHESFQTFLESGRFSVMAGANFALWVALALAQLGIALSEMVLLREVLILGFRMPPPHATALTLSIALITYTYCLISGYGGVFRTDIAQFLALIIMVSWLGLLSVEGALVVDIAQAAQTQPDHGQLWTFGKDLGPLFTVVLHVLVGYGMGIALPVGTPDTWKRVHLSLRRSRIYSSFWVMLVAGFLPFLALMPLLVKLVRAGPQSVLPLELLFRGEPTSGLLIALLIGMISAFMSTFDSALVTSAHILLLRPRPLAAGSMSNLQVYRQVLGVPFLVLVLVSLVFFGYRSNPYLVGGFLAGPFGLLCGCLLGTRVLQQPMRGFAGPRVLGGLALAWTVYFLHFCSTHDVLGRPSLEQATTFPAAAALLLLSYVLSRLLRVREEKTSDAGSG